jgi:SPX domain protein involved in polyphosphate accumulation
VLQTPAPGASLRSFNRFELKYLADRALVPLLRAELAARLDRDRFSAHGTYQVWSRYYDTGDLRFYWEKIDGIRFRRKLRIRHYGEPRALAHDTAVWVEIKQRVNRVTQKRRARLGYAAALALCSGREQPAVDAMDAAVADEVVRMVGELALRPVTIVGYVREPYIGRDADIGLRVTIDSRIRARDRDLDLALEGENRFAVRPDLSIVEVKVNERVPTWLTDRIARHNLQLIRISKYCQSVEAFGKAPRSLFHVPDGGLAAGEDAT